MIKSQLRIIFNVEYPYGHKLSSYVGHSFTVDKDQVDKIAKLTIACVELNGGKCSVNKTVLLLGFVLGDVEADFLEIASVVFKKDLNEKIDAARKIWRQINRCSSTKK